MASRDRPRGSSVDAASARRSIGCCEACSRVTAGCWSCAARQGSARPRCWSTSWRASGWRIVRAAGVQSEMELAFAGVHQLCGPRLDGLGGLPGPQRDALGKAFGLQNGSAPERFLVALAVLSLLAAAAEAEPLGSCRVG